MKMMKYRGYDVPKDIQFLNPITLTNKTRSTRIYWLDKCGISHLKKIHSEISEGIDTIIILNSITSYAKTVIKLFNEKIKILYRNRYLINILDNFLVDKHVVCNRKEKDQVFRDFGISENECPEIHIDDPMVEYIGGEIGDLIKVYRSDDENNGIVTSLYYRLVVQ